MSSTTYNIQLERLCRMLELGEITGQPEALTGGLLHRMYAVETTKGKYAIKALNPEIMSRTGVMQNMIRSEQIATIAANHVPALPAKQFNGMSVQQVDQQCYLVFDWVEGSSLQPHEITTAHCERIGEIVADIHRTDFSGFDADASPCNGLTLSDWNGYLQQGRMNHAPWCDLLSETVNQLYDWQAKANDAAVSLAANTVMSHLDLDSKNVLWHQGSPILIDWEAFGHINPMQHVCETAVYWSGKEQGQLDKDRFLAFVGGYKKKCGPLQANWEMVMENGYSGMLGWLEYSLKRSLGMEGADEQDRQMGTEQATATLYSLLQYTISIPQIEQWLIEESG